MFFYDPASAKFFLVGGTPGGTYGDAQHHFEVESFDPQNRKWANVYPAGAPYKPESGVTDAPAIKEEDTRRSLVVNDKNGVSRIGFYTTAYSVDTRAHFQWAYDDDSKTLFAYLHNQTLRYDLAQRAWSDTGAAPFTKGTLSMVWGNMCYDGVNKEILSIGGSNEEPGGTPGTWVYKIDENVWRKIDVASKSFNDAHADAVLLRRKAWALVSACRSRYFITETDDEAKTRLSQSAAALKADCADFLNRHPAPKADGIEAAAVARGGKTITEAIAALGVIAPKLDHPITPDVIGEMKAIDDQLEAAELAMAAEPLGRAHSQCVFDPKNAKIVLFGGNGLDRCYADTWLYDCKTRRWEQKYPPLSPSPRAGHALVYLPRSGKIALAGGYTIDGRFKSIPHQLWIYDLAANRWSILLSLPGGKDDAESENAPCGGTHGNYAGAASAWAGAGMPDDTLVMVDTFTKGRATWACRIDVTKADANETQKLGVPPGTMSFSHQPAEWEKAAQPDPAKTADFFANLPANQWTQIAQTKPVDQRAWSTSAYDPDRQQWLYWGGGHVTYMGTDVAHYSVRANCWTIGYPPDMPTEPTGGFYVKAALSFQDRPQVPVHAYRAYAYDPPSGRMFFLSRAYNVSERQWEPRPYPGLQHDGASHTLLETTPHGVVALSKHGLFRFEWAQKAWVKLPWNGPDFGEAWCDGHALCYDASRDCLWAANKQIFKYDVKTGVVEKLPIIPPKRLGEYALWEEHAYVPGADLILLMRRFKDAGGNETNIAFAPAEQKYYALDLPFSDGKPHNFSWSSAMRFDPKLNALLLHDRDGNTDGHIWALRLERKNLKMAAIEPGE